MAATGDPPDESIDMLCDIIGIPRSEAITRLKANSNDIQRATDEYFEDPNSLKYKWDESQFSMDRHGEPNDTGISFNIQGPDELSPTSYQNNAAPTRPPSRANNPSPFGAPASAAEEDANLERALAESAAESGIQLQESGVVDNDKNLTYFGPASRSWYESNEWAMVPTKANAENVQTDPPPSKRKRAPDAPAFLRQTKDFRLGYMMSIYHKIPLARNTLLQVGAPARNYGYNSEWWRGQSILKHEHLAAMARGEQVWGDDAHPDFSEELHRLMAFLDRTERSYGTADALMDTKAVDPSYGSWTSDVEEKVFDAIKEEAANSPACDLGPLTTVGTILSCAPVSSDIPQQEGDFESFGDEDKDSPFIFLDVVLDSEQYSWVNTFYNALDYLLWTHALSMDHSFPDDANFAVLSKAAEVVTVRLGGTGLDKPCEIPAVFYVDRYMKERKELALRFQAQIRAAKRKIRLFDALGASLVQCNGERCRKINGLESGPHDVFACLNGIIKHTKRLMEQQIRTAQWRYHFDRIGTESELGLDDLFDIHMWTGPYTFLPEEEERMKQWEKAIDECNKKIQELKVDLADLVNEKEEYIQALKVISKRLTCQEHEVDNDEYVFRSTPAYNPEYWNPANKYSLRGVALTGELAYICVRQDDLMNVDEVTESRDQWWKIGYSSTDATPVKTEKTTIDDVLHAAGTESKFPILIYATEAAMDVEPLPLSDALRMFAKADNRTFQQELDQEQNQEQVLDQPTQEPPPTEQFPTTADVNDQANAVASSQWLKRKYSVASSVATHGSSRDNLSDVDLTFDEPNPESGVSKSPEQEAREAQLVSGMQAETGYDTTDEMQISTPAVKSPEMQERAGGPAPFLGRPAQTTRSGPVDMMDIDLEVEHHKG
ncbi:hypothetical protein M426DRAFT_317746 [Hypoxylon sp. CI-4A]|nr:hypothetical protein M426DRAFT_317746 [Hypoxylon sp. CI-4A]